MIQLFPRYQKRILLNTGIWLAFLAAFYMLYPVVSPLLLVAAAIIGFIVIVLMQATYATNAHSRLLNILYNELDVERFLNSYEPLLDVPVKNPQLSLMLRLHLSNAYCAQGRFEDAISLLESVELKNMKHEQALLGEFALTSNLCYCAEQTEDLPTAKKHLDKLLAIKAQLEEMQKSKPENKRMVFSSALNEQCVRFLETGTADVEFLKSHVQANNTQQLHKVTTSLWIARVYLAENNRREAEKLLTRIVELAPDIYPGRCAKEILDQLPAKNS